MSSPTSLVTLDRWYGDRSVIFVSCLEWSKTAIKFVKLWYLIEWMNKGGMRSEADTYLWRFSDPSDARAGKRSFQPGVYA